MQQHFNVSGVVGSQAQRLMSVDVCPGQGRSLVAQYHPVSPIPAQQPARASWAS